MSLTKICPHCAAGHVARFRARTSEWVHDLGKDERVIHTICLNSEAKNEEAKANG